jgi:hypothetical protein
MRYRPFSSVPGTNRPSSEENDDGAEVWETGREEATVSAEVSWGSLDGGMSRFYSAKLRHCRD